MNAIANPLDPAHPLPDRGIVIVGMPGAGKSSIGRKLATRLALPFVDADTEIEAAAGMSIPQIFEKHGEPAFRQGEKRVIARLLQRPPLVLATGGGAFMDAETRALIRERAVSVWLRADLAILAERTARHDNRPMLRVDAPEEVLKKLLAAREPLYAEADITVQSDTRPPEETAERVLQALSDYARLLGHNAAPADEAP